MASVTSFMPPPSQQGNTALTAMSFSLGCLLYSLLMSKQDPAAVDSDA